MGKGSGRRPQQAPDDEVASHWANIFGKKKHDSQQRTDTGIDEQKESHEPSKGVDRNADSLSSPT